MMCKDGESSGNFEEGYEKSEWQHGQVGRMDAILTSCHATL